MENYQHEWRKWPPVRGGIREQGKCKKGKSAHYQIGMGRKAVKSVFLSYATQKTNVLGEKNGKNDSILNWRKGRKSRGTDSGSQ